MQNNLDSQTEKQLLLSRIAQAARLLVLGILVTSSSTIAADENIRRQPNRTHNQPFDPYGNTHSAPPALVSRKFDIKDVLEESN